MGLENLPLVIMLWATLSFIRMVIEYFSLQKEQIVLVFAGLQAAAFLITLNFGFVAGMIVCAVANICFYWYVKPKLVKEINQRLDD